jgi:hypothetical protein
MSERAERLKAIFDFIEDFSAIAGLVGNFVRAARKALELDPDLDFSKTKIEMTPEQALDAARKELDK